jgi:23S rRNA (uracil1939-C5)-methyltransferase
MKAPMLLTIEKPIYGGDGLAHLPPDERGRGKAVFVPFVLEGEQVEATAVEEKPGFIRARLDRVIAPAPLRAEPPCPYYQRCGGCHYQHTGYEHQLEIKTAVLRENLARFAKLEWTGEIAVHASPPLHYRNRTRLQVRTHPEFMLAYFRHDSRELLPVEECPISSELINKAIAGIWDLGRGGHMPDKVREIEFFADDDRKHLLIELYLDVSAPGRPGVQGIALDSNEIERCEIAMFALSQGRQFREPQLMRPKDADWPVPSLTYAAAGAQYRVSAGSFFQTNRFLTDKMVELVTGGRSGKVALDLYAGVGLFAVPLAKNFERVLAVEASPSSVADLKHNAPRNVRVVQETTDRFLAGSTAPTDLVVVDPPRAGLGEKVTRALLRLSAPRITYVSCDPSTLARDLRGLLAGGYKVEQIHLLDLFPQTFHIETLVQLVR